MSIVYLKLLSQLPSMLILPQIVVDVLTTRRPLFSSWSKYVKDRLMVRILVLVAMHINISAYSTLH
jgi:hypothetical protein